MKTAKLTWLFIASMMATLAVMPAQTVAATEDIRVQFEVVRSEVPIPAGETFPYVNIWKIWCMTDNIGDWAVATNRTRADLADVEVPDDITTVMFKMFIHENMTGYYVNPFYLGPNTNLTAGTYGTTAEGAPYVTTAYGDNSSDVYDNTEDWDMGPVIDWWGGMLVGGTELSQTILTYTSVITLPMGRHVFSLSVFTKDCIDDGTSKLVEQWLTATDYVDIYLHRAEEAESEEEDPLSLVFGLLAILSVSTIALIRRKK